MWVFGPDLHFDVTGRQLEEHERTHFWYIYFLQLVILIRYNCRYPSLTNKLGEDLQDKFSAISFKPDPTHDLTTLLEAARPPQTWECLLTNAIYLSGTAMHFVRKVTKQYPVVSSFFIPLPQPVCLHCPNATINFVKN